MKKNLVKALLLSLGFSASAQAADQFIWVEAETGAEMNPIVVKSDLAASQAIYLGSWKWADYGSRSAASGMISFDVYIPEAGDYKLWARMRLPWSGSQPYDVSAGSGDTADSSQWKLWKKDDNASKDWLWSDSGFVQYFNKGMNKIHLVQREGGPDVRLDKILLTNAAAYKPTGAGAKEPGLDIENPYRTAAVEKYGQLKVVGNQLTDKSGQAVQLKGVSLHGLQWFPTVNKQTIPHITEFFGAEAVRLAMYIEDYAPTDPSDFWGGFMADRSSMMVRTEAAIQDAVNAGMYVLVDWHIHNTPSKYTTEAVEFFTYISKKYGHLPNIVYEICNEPVSVSWSSGIKPYANTVINAIRQNDPDNIIIVGTPNWSQDVDAAAKDPLTASNVMYAFHYYAATHDFNTMKNKVETALNSGLAIFVSEWGSSDVGTSRSDFNVAKQWMDYMNQRKLSWVNWSLGNKDESSSILKPNAPLSGPWTNADLTQAGTWLKPYFNTAEAGGGTSTSSASSSSSGLVSSSSSSSGSGGTVSSSSSSGSTGDLVLEAEKHHMSQNVVNFENMVGYFDANDYIGFRSVDLTGISKATLKYAANTSGIAEIRADSLNGQLLTTINVNSTGGYNNFQEFTFNVNAMNGVHDLYIVARSGQGIFNLDKITLTRTTGASSANIVIEAEGSAMASNVTIIANEGILAYFDASDLFGFRAVDLNGARQAVLRFATANNGGVVEIRTDHAGGQLLATINVSSTGGYHNYQNLTVSLNGASGVRDLYFLGRSGVGIFNLDKITLVKN